MQVLDHACRRSDGVSRRGVADEVRAHSALAGEDFDVDDAAVVRQLVQLDAQLQVGVHTEDSEPRRRRREDSLQAVVVALIWKC